MKATLLLGDYARASDGKLDVLGAGWDVTGPGPATFGIGILFSVPWDEANAKHRFVLDLVDADGNQLVLPGAEEPLLRIEGDGFEVGRPAGLKPGCTQNHPLAFNVSAAPIPPGGRYEVRLVLDGDEDSAVCVAFATRPAGPQSMAA